MKKILLFFIVPLLFSGCKKEQKTTPSDTDVNSKKYKVSYNISGFTQKISKTSTEKNVNEIGGTDLASQFDVLCYDIFVKKSGIYNGDPYTGYALLNVVTQYSTDPNFGNFSDSLPAGEYMVTLFGGKTGIKIVQSINGYSFYYPAKVPDDFKWDDTFYKKDTLIIKDKDVVENINLERIVGKLEINFEDVIPPNAKTIICTYSKDYTYYDFKYGNPKELADMVNTVTIPASAIGTNNFKVTAFVMNTGAYVTVNINCYDAASNLISTRKIESVPIEKNKVTKLSGNLFDTNSSFDIKVNDTWDPSTIIINY